MFIKRCIIKLVWLLILWISACPKSELYKLPNLAGMPVTCSISSKCTEIWCCLQVEPIGRNFEVYINLDSCNKTLTVGVEQYRIKINLLTYKFGELKRIDLWCNTLLEPCLWHFPMDKGSVHQYMHVAWLYKQILGYWRKKECNCVLPENNVFKIFFDYSWFKECCYNCFFMQVQRRNSGYKM